MRMTLVSMLVINLVLVPAIGSNAGDLEETDVTSVSGEQEYNAMKESGDRPTPTPRMVTIAHILSGHWVENEWFSKSDVVRTQELRIYPRDAMSVLTSHPRFFDKVHNPERCAVERSFLTHTGAVQRTEVIRLECADFWEEIRYVDAYFEKFGSLPTSSMDLDLSTLIEFETPPDKTPEE